MKLESNELEMLREALKDKRNDTAVIVDTLRRYLREIAIILDDLYETRGEKRNH